jgi:MSHA biogenesis protein MshO
MVILSSRSNNRGFTLIELIIVITIAGIVAVLAATMLGNQMLGFVDLTRRAKLVDQAHTAVTQMARDIRHALPNSLRATTSGGSSYLELVPIKDAGRYRAVAGASAGESDILDFSGADNSFQVIGRLPSVANNDRLVVYNIGQVNAGGVPVRGANVYADVAVGAPTSIPEPGSHVITDAGLTLAGDILTMTGGHQFAFQSPRKRFYVINQAQSFICDMANQRIVRYQGYDLQSNQPSNLLAPPLSGASSQSILIENVTECAFEYAPGNAQRSGLLTIALTVSENGERVRLAHQVHVDNSP